MQLKMPRNYVQDTLLFVKGIRNLYLVWLMSDDDLSECCCIFPDRPVSGISKVHESVKFMHLQGRSGNIAHIIIFSLI